MTPPIQAPYNDNIPPTQAPFTAPCYGAGTIVIDKTGTVFQVWTGRLTANGPWGPHVWRTVKGGKPELIWFIANANGTQLIIMNKQLFFSYTVPNGGQWLQLISGYIDPSDTPSSQVVNVDESALNAVKQSIATTNTLANSAYSLANSATNVSNNAMNKVNSQQTQINALQNQINQLQQQIISRSTIEDIVWQKIWDVNYLIRQGFVAGNSSIQQVQDYLVDLATYIRKVMK